MPSGSGASTIMLMVMPLLVIYPVRVELFHTTSAPKASAIMRRGIWALFSTMKGAASLISGMPLWV